MRKYDGKCYATIENKPFILRVNEKKFDTFFVCLQKFYVISYVSWPLNYKFFDEKIFESVVSKR